MLSNKRHILSIIVIQAVVLNNFVRTQSPVDCSYCKPYTAVENDPPNYRDESGRPRLFMGSTYSKNYYLMNVNTTGDFFQSVLSTCARYGMDPVDIVTACEYCIFEKWFFSHYPTTYVVWIGGFRMGGYTQPMPFWVRTGSPLDFSQFNLNAAYTNGDYPPGGYSPIVYPWQNCLTITRNCAIYSAGPTNPCEQTATYPPIRFAWADCRISTFRVACQETSYSKEGQINEIDDE